MLLPNFPVSGLARPLQPVSLLKQLSALFVRLSVGEPNLGARTKAGAEDLFLGNPVPSTFPHNYLFFSQSHTTTHMQRPPRTNPRMRNTHRIRFALSSLFRSSVITSVCIGPLYGSSSHTQDKYHLGLGRTRIGSYSIRMGLLFRNPSDVGMDNSPQT